MNDRLKDAVSSVIRGLLPDLAVMTPATYRVQSCAGGKFSARPEEESLGLPPIVDAQVGGSILGGHTLSQLSKGTLIVVGFRDRSRSRPFLMTILDHEPSDVAIGPMSPTEHVTTIEAVTILLHNFFAALAQAQAGPWIGATVGPTITVLLNAAIAALGAPAPPGAIAQTAAAPAIASSMATGLPGNTVAPYSASLASLATKTDDVSGLFPSLGSAKVKVG